MNTVTQMIDIQQPDPALLATALFDEDGFLSDTSVWSDDLARQIAGQDGISLLTDDHWIVIRHLREHYSRLGGVPAMRLVCRRTGLHKTAIHGLFKGGCRAIWRIAGLPDPGEEARAYF